MANNVTDTTEMADLDFPSGMDPNTIPTFTQLPLGHLEFEIKGWSQDVVETSPRGMPDAPKVAKVVVKVQFALSETPDGKRIGLPYTKTFWIGSDLDPLADGGLHRIPEARRTPEMLQAARDLANQTWAANAGPLMKVLKKAKVATSKGLHFRDMMNAAVGSRLMGRVIENKTSHRRDIVDFYAVAEKKLEYFEAPTASHANGAIPAALAGGVTEAFEND